MVRASIAALWGVAKEHRFAALFLGSAIVFASLLTIGLVGRSSQYRRLAQYHALEQRAACERADQLRRSLANLVAARAKAHEMKVKIASSDGGPSKGASPAESERVKRLVVKAQETHIRMLRANIETQSARAEYHAKLQHKYQRAASHPWEPLADDPLSPGCQPPLMNRLNVRN